MDWVGSFARRSRTLALICPLSMNFIRGAQQYMSVSKQANPSRFIPGVVDNPFWKGGCTKTSVLTCREWSSWPWILEVWKA